MKTQNKAITLLSLLSMLASNAPSLAATDFATNSIKAVQQAATSSKKGGAIYIEPPMVTVPGGEYQMGGGKPYMGEAAQDPSALPIHKVKVTTFKLAKYEVTVAEFRRFVETTGYKAPQQCVHQPNQGWFSEGPTPGSWDKNALTTSEFQPVVCVGWAGAEAYAKWLSQETGKSYRLASEAEWEYAAGAGRGKPGFPFGDDIDQQQICQYANVSDQSGEHAGMARFGASYKGFMGGISACDDGAGFSSIVGMYQANPLGIYDLIGNVAEYVQDCWTENYQGAPADGSARLDGDCKMRVGRGGAWHWRSMTVTQRGPVEADWVGAIEGFRLALSLNSPADHRPAPSAAIFEKKLAQAQAVERNRRKNLLPFPLPPQGLQVTQDQNGTRLSWKPSTDAKLAAYHIFRSESVGGEMVKIAENVKTTSYVDETPPARKHSYVVVAVNRDRFSEFSNPVTTADLVLTLPGKIQAEDFNQMERAVVGQIDPQEDMDDNGGKAGLNLSGFAPGIAKDSWTEYRVEVARAGNYRIAFRVASLDGSKGLSLDIDGKSVIEQTVPATGGFKNWQTIATSNTIRIEAGTHVLRINAIDGGWKLNWFSLELDQ